MKLGFKTSQMNVEWSVLLDTWRAGDELDVFDSAWLFDHFRCVPDGPGGSHEGWTVAAALATQTTRLRFGHLVLGNTHRHPALLARMAATLDVISNGRFIVGLGAGWHPGEHEMFGWRLPPVPERLDALEAAVVALKGIWSNPTGYTMIRGPYQLEDATCYPTTISPDGPPIWLGTQGKQRGLRIVARHADGWNAATSPVSGHGSVKDFAVKRELLLRYCDEVGRDPAEIEMSAQLMLGQGGMKSLLDEAHEVAEMHFDHLILGIPASGGPKLLTALAEQVATPLLERWSD